MDSLVFAQYKKRRKDGCGGISLFKIPYDSGKDGSQLEKNREE